MNRRLINYAAAFSILTSLASAEHYRVYLLGGQSNGNGRADAAQLATPLNAPQTDVRFYWHRTQDADNIGHLAEDQWIDLAPGSGHGTGPPVGEVEFGSEISFGRTMADASPEANIAIIKYTHGGTNLYSQWSSTGFQYTTFVSTVKTALANLVSDGHSYELRGMFWQQGEADSNGSQAGNYEANLTDFISRVRNDLAAGQPLPFVIGTLSDSQYTNITTVGTGPYRVRQAQEAVAASDPAVGIVITDGFGVRSDVIHFNAAGMVALGQGFAAEMLELQGDELQKCPGRPNVIFILGDDQSWYDYSFMYGKNAEKAVLDSNPAVLQVAKTPAIDRLATEGLTYLRGYTTPLCRPSLAAIFTGTHPHQNWITGNDLVGRPPDEAVEARMQVFHPLAHTLATRLGYTSFQTGKWWEGNFSNGGFTFGDTVNSTATGSAPAQWSGGRPSYVRARHGDWGLMTGRVDYVNDIEEPAHPIPYANTVTTVTDFIDSQVSVDQPFFISYAPFLPHTPHDPPPGLLAEYTALGLNNTDATYYANVERFDGGVGAILDHLDAKGIADNTLIVMICDNGRDEPDPAGKQFPYESGVRTPIIIRWPDRIKPGGEIEPQMIKTPVSLIDMVPTVHHALGLPVYPEMTGIDLMDPSAVAARNTIFGADYSVDIQELEDPAQSLESRFAIRNGWKLIRFTNGTDELYELYDPFTGNPVDPFENNNVAGNNPTLIGELASAITDWYDTPVGQQVTNSEAASFSVANDDLLQTSLAAVDSVTTTGDFTSVAGIPVTGEATLRNGLWENDANDRGNAGVSDGSSVTYQFDLTTSPLGYTIDQIDLYSNWGSGQGRDEIRVSIDYALVASPTNFDNHIVINESYNPPNESQGRMSITNIRTPGVAAIRFTWPASQENGAVGYSELDVIGSPDGSDTTAPGVPLLTPANGAGQVTIGSNLSMNFCEPIQPGAGMITIKRTDDDTVVESFNIANSARLSFSPFIVTIDPSADLLAGESYYVLLDAGAIRDTAGNSFPGFVESTEWNFAGDAGAPNVVSTTPATGTSGVAPLTTLSLTFDEEIQAGNGNLTIRLASDNSDVEVINVNSTTVTVAGSTVTFNRSSSLAPGTAYYINLSPGAFTDLSGNSHAGLSGSSVWNFQVGQGESGPSLLHHWKFDGDAVDSVGSAHGTLDGDAGFTAPDGGKLGGAITLDGAGDAIRAGGASVPATDYTLMAWVFWNGQSSSGSRGTIAGAQNSGNEGEVFTMSRSADGTDRKLFLNLLPSNGSTSITESADNTIAIAAWQHVAYSVSSTEGTSLYLNGEVVQTNPTRTAHIPSSLPNFSIGARPDSTTANPGWFDGMIDEVAIFDGVLSQTQISNAGDLGAGNFLGAANTFASWISDPALGIDPTERGFDDDPDGDGLPNALEAFFGTHPGQWSEVISNLATNGTTTTFTHPQNPDAPADVRGNFYDWSNDLDIWYSGGSGPTGGPTVIFTTNTIGNITTVTATASEPMESLFLRARVTGGQNE